MRSIREQPSLIQPNAGPAHNANAAGSVAANAFNSGDILLGKIAGVRVLASPSASSKVLFTLKRGDELVFIGPDSDGFLKVQGAEGEGWVDKRLVKRP